MTSPKYGCKGELYLAWSWLLRASLSCMRRTASCASRGCRLFHHTVVFRVPLFNFAGYDNCIAYMYRYVTGMSYRPDVALQYNWHNKRSTYYFPCTRLLLRLFALYFRVQNVIRNSRPGSFSFACVIGWGGVASSHGQSSIWISGIRCFTCSTRTRRRATTVEPNATILYKI